MCYFTIVDVCKRAEPAPQGPGACNIMFEGRIGFSVTNCPNRCPRGFNKRHYDGYWDEHHPAGTIYKYPRLCKNCWNATGAANDLAMRTAKQGAGILVNMAQSVPMAVTAGYGPSQSMPQQQSIMPPADPRRIAQPPAPTASMSADTAAAQTLLQLSQAADSRPPAGNTGGRRLRDSSNAPSSSNRSSTGAGQSSSTKLTQKYRKYK